MRPSRSQTPSARDCPLGDVAFLDLTPNPLRPDPESSVERLMADPAERARLGSNGRAYVERHAGREAAMRAYQSLLAGPSGQTGHQWAAEH